MGHNLKVSNVSDVKTDFIGDEEYFFVFTLHHRMVVDDCIKLTVYLRSVVLLRQKIRQTYHVASKCTLCILQPPIL